MMNGKLGSEVTIASQIFVTHNEKDGQRAGALELGRQGGHVPTHFFALSLLKRDFCPPTFYYQ